MKLVYFDMSEFDCNCGRQDCDAKPFSPFLALKLDQARRELGEPININRGTSCAFWNQHIGGAKNSQHLDGLAVDIACPSSNYAFRLISILLKLGVTGIGFRNGMIHCDIRPGQPVFFAYD